MATLCDGLNPDKKAGLPVPPQNKGASNVAGVDSVGGGLFIPTHGMPVGRYNMGRFMSDEEWGGGGSGGEGA